MKSELVIAADLADCEALPALIAGLPPEVLWYKIGLELFTARGTQAIDILRNANKQVFLDLKLHDIPRTVARAVSAAARHGIGMLTVHAGGGPAMLTAAAEAAAGAGPERPRIVAVTALTSLDQDDLAHVGVTRPLQDHALSLAEMALAAGVDGLVCSPREAARFRQALGPNPILVTPGIRPAGAEPGDQKRVATPRAAVEAGANYLVVGRPIVQAEDPRAAARDILNQMQD